MPEESGLVTHPTVSKSNKRAKMIEIARNLLCRWQFNHVKGLKRDLIVWIEGAVSA
jgi:hypothetical protein